MRSLFLSNGNEVFLPSECHGNELVGCLLRGKSEVGVGGCRGCSVVYHKTGQMGVSFTLLERRMKIKGLETTSGEWWKRR